MQPLALSQDFRSALSAAKLVRGFFARRLSAAQRPDHFGGGFCDTAAANVLGKVGSAAGRLDEVAAVDQGELRGCSARLLGVARTKDNRQKPRASLPPR